MTATTSRYTRLFGVLAIAALGTALGGCDVSDGTDNPDESTAQNSDALSTNEHTAYSFFVAKGLTKYQAAGVVGNLIQESSVNPKAVEFGGGPGRGIAQWSVGGRWNHDFHDNVSWYAAAHGQSPWSLSLQLNFVWYELTHFSGYGLNALKDSHTIAAATIAFEEHFEGCGTCDQSKRIQYADQVYNAFH